MQQAPVTSGQQKPHKLARPDVVTRALKQKDPSAKPLLASKHRKQRRAVRPDGESLQDAALASAKPGSQQGEGEWQKALRRVG